MDMKVEIKEEPCFQDFYSENERDDKDLVKKVKIETSDNDIKPELEDSKCFSLNEEDHIMKFNETIKESEIETKIDIKEEHSWLEREDSGVHDDIKDGTQQDFYATKQPSLYKEDISTYASDLSFIEDLESDASFNINMSRAECESDRKGQGQEHVFADISIETGVCPETSNDGKIVSIASPLKQSESFKQSLKNKQDINMDSCKSFLSQEYRMSYKYDVSNKSSKYLFHLEKYSLPLDSKKEDKFGILKNGLNELSVKTHKFIDEGKGKHSCNICNKSFITLQRLKLHKLIHEGIKPHKCNNCNKAFTQLATLNTHKMIHEGRKPHECNICNKAFTQLSTLKRHKLIHEGRKPHKCNICNKAFRESSYLKKHKLIHGGVQPHKCIICNKSFSQSCNLKTHKMIHEGIKPHKCNICDKAFTRLSDVKRHILIHEGIKAHKCNICNKAFSDFAYVKKHKLILHGIQPHKCNI